MTPTLSLVGRAEELPLSDESVDLVLTSPPYDGIRDYQGRPAVDLPKVGREVARVLIDGGVAVVVLQDQTKNGRKSLTTFRTAVSWCDDAGLGLWECLIWRRHGAPGAWWNRRFRVDHEYVLVFVKGKRPRHFNKEHTMVPAIGAGRPIHGYVRQTDGGRLMASGGNVAKLKCPGTVLGWNPTKCEPRDADRALKRRHPATFPQALASDLIRCFTLPGNVVLDPFSGSGTTLVEARRLGRLGVGVDVEPSYARIARDRLAA